MKFTTTDVDAFLKYADEAIRKGEEYSISLSYGSSYASAFNAVSGEPTAFYDSIELSSPLPALFSQEITICSDWFFITGPPGEMSVTITVFNSARMVISRVRDIKFPIEGGKTTTVKGDFLTNFYSNNISVDNIWDEEIIVNVD